MAKFVTYEVWTKARIIEAESMEDAYTKGEPQRRVSLSLCNWHVVPVDSRPTELPQSRPTGGLNYTQGIDDAKS